MLSYVIINLMTVVYCGTQFNYIHELDSGYIYSLKDSGVYLSKDNQLIQIYYEETPHESNWTELCPSPKKE
jgi:hypothetical protein